MADKIRNISGSKCFLPPLWTKWTGIFMNCPDDRSLMSARILTSRHSIPRLGAHKPALNLGKSWESGVHCEWIFPVSVLAICLPSRPNFLQHRVTLTWVQAKGWELRWDNNHKNITRAKNISQALGEFPLILIHRISNSFGLSDKSSLKVGKQKYSVDI